MARWRLEQTIWKPSDLTLQVRRFLLSAQCSEVRMNRYAQMFRRLLVDETGGEVIEYALILGMILVICIVTIANFGTKVLARWGSVNSSM
jgi:Flp pilus assembly pilin Flp